MSLELYRLLDMVGAAIAHGQELKKKELKSVRAVEDVRNDVRRWDAMNKELLRSIDKLPALYAEYESLFAQLPTTLGEIVYDAGILKAAIRDRAEFLLSVQERINLWGSKMQYDLQAFIVHGHDKALLFEVKDYLQNTLGLPSPVVLFQQGSGGRTIIEKFEEYSERVDLAVVLLSADDQGAKVGEEPSKRARQNVIFELGYFVGRFGRRSGRVLVLHKGDLELPSDLAGLIYLDVSAGIEQAGERIRKELSMIAKLGR